jgi:outer membrane protein assembly factor BamD
MLRLVNLPGLVLAALLVAACSSGFELARYQTNESLFAASLAEFQRGRWDNAIAGFERLTLQLPARDTLLPRAHWYLGEAHQRRGDDLLAAQSYVRLVEGFPADTLADDALFEAARAYQRIWRKPELSSEYGETALTTFQTLLSAFPDSPRRADAEREIARLQDWMARKDHDTGEYYVRRRAYDSAIIYFQDVVAKYPDTPTARLSSLKLLDVYRRLNYREEADEVCARLRTKYPSDAEVREACGTGPAAPAAPRAPPPDTGGASRR